MRITESTVRNILLDPLDHTGWTIQGLGMLRLELTPDGSERLHIWDPDMEANGVASAHDHPWDIEESRIVFGSMGNQRYRLDDTHGVPMQASLVQCGIGSHLLGNPRPVLLTEARPFEQYGPDDTYDQLAEELHNSFPLPGTVTAIKRRFRDDRTTATICWAGGGDWKQEGFTRVATAEEIMHFAGLARLRMAE